MKKTISIVVILAFLTTMVITPRASYAQGVMGLPTPGSMVDISPSYVPVMITGLTVHPDNPLLMDFIVNTGNSGMSAGQVKNESDRLIKYFLACLTIPENDQWVNLSPYEKQRIVPEELGQTVLGRDMMAQDYLLKQLTASLIYPEKNLGKSFWDRVYAKASEMYGTTQIPVNTFNKVWILPDTANVFEHKDTVFVVKSHLKVMLDEDYLSLQKHLNSPSLIQEENKGDFKGINSLGNQLVRQIILPAIEQEVNTGVNFSRLRQIYNSMILAVWFKKNLKEALLNQVYTDKSKINGVNVDDPTIKERIYRQYVQAYRKGVFNYIKEEADPGTQEIIPRKYFSGGLTPVTAAILKSVSADDAMSALSVLPGTTFMVSGLTLMQGATNQLPVAPGLNAGTGLELSELEENLRTIVSNESSEASRRIGVNQYKPAPAFVYTYNGQELDVSESLWPNAPRASWTVAVNKIKAGLANGNASSMKFNLGVVKQDGRVGLNITDAARAGGKALLTKSYMNVALGHDVTVEYRYDGTYTHVRTVNPLPGDVIQFSARFREKGNFTDRAPVDVVSEYYRQKELLVDEAMTSGEGTLVKDREMQLEPNIRVSFDTNAGEHFEITTNENGTSARINYKKDGQAASAVVDAENNSASIYNVTIHVEGGQVLVQNGTGEALNYMVGDKAMAVPGNSGEALTGKPAQDLENILSTKVLSVKDKIQPLMDAYYAAKSAGQADEVKRLDGEINKIVDQLNVYNQSKPENLILSNDVESLSGFLSGPNAGQYQNMARGDLLQGNYVPQFIFAGSATRLNRGPMYNLDIWDIAVELGKAQNTDAKSRLGMGPRQILAYRMALEGLAKQSGESPEEVLARQKMIVNVNADIEQIVLNDFIQHNYYGFSPQNVYFITQPTFRGYKYQNGGLEFDSQSATIPYGHGHNFMQLGEKGQAFTLTPDGNRHYLQDSILNQFSDSVLIGSHRINDLTKLSETSVVSVDKLAFALAKLEEGFDVIGELVDNPNKQKGGNALKDTESGKSFLIETSNVKGDERLVKLLEEAGKTNAPYNAFRLVYKVGSLKNILAKSLPFNLRFKDGDFYLEAVTGDVTQMAETKAKFMSSGEQIHDFKEPKNIDDALNYLRQSDEQLSSTANAAMIAPVAPRLMDKNKFIAEAALGGIKVKSKIVITLNSVDSQGRRIQVTNEAQFLGYNLTDGSIKIIRPVNKIPLKSLAGFKRDGYESFKPDEIRSISVTDAAMLGNQPASEVYTREDFRKLIKEHGVRAHKQIDIITSTGGVIKAEFQRIVKGSDMRIPGEALEQDEDIVVYSPLHEGKVLDEEPLDALRLADIQSIVIPSDAAMASTPSFNKGGIDINSKFLNLQSEGQKVNVAFDPALIAQFKRGDFSGVSIKILKVAPVNLMPLLGLGA